MLLPQNRTARGSLLSRASEKTNVPTSPPFRRLLFAFTALVSTRIAMPSPVVGILYAVVLGLLAVIVMVPDVAAAMRYLPLVARLVVSV